MAVPAAEAADGACFPPSLSENSIIPGNPPLKGGKPELVGGVQMGVPIAEPLARLSVPLR